MSAVDTGELDSSAGVPLAVLAASLTPTEPIGALQVQLMRTWARVDPDSAVAQHPSSHVETFRDLAKTALTEQGVDWGEVNRGGDGK